LAGSNERFAVVDQDDGALVADYNWHLRLASGGRLAYARTNLRLPDGRWAVRGMHQLLLGRLTAQDGLEADHVDHDGLNNRRSNLRLIANGLNQANKRKKHAAASSNYKGIAQNSGLWVARLQHGGRPVHLGRFPSAVEAAMAYDDAALVYFGRHACLNFPR
jgi:hypothetical protein